MRRIFCLVCIVVGLLIVPLCAKADYHPLWSAKNGTFNGFVPAELLFDNAFWNWCGDNLQIKFNDSYILLTEKEEMNSLYCRPEFFERSGQFYQRWNMVARCVVNDQPYPVFDGATLVPYIIQADYGQPLWDPAERNQETILTSKKLRDAISLQIKITRLGKFNDPDWAPDPGSMEISKKFKPCPAE